MMKFKKNGLVDAPCSCFSPALSPCTHRLADADEEDNVRNTLCIGFIMMHQNNIRRTTPFRRTIDFNFARRSTASTGYQYLDTPDRAVPTLSPNRHSTSPIVEVMNSHTGAEFSRMFRLSRMVFATLIVELPPWITTFF